MYMVGKKTFTVNLDTELSKNFGIKCGSESKTKGEVITRMVQNFVAHGQLYLDWLDESVSAEEFEKLKEREEKIVEQTEVLTGKKIDESRTNLSVKERDRLIKIFELCRSNADAVMQTKNDVSTSKNASLFEKTDKFVQSMNEFANEKPMAQVVGASIMLFTELRTAMVQNDSLLKTVKSSITNLDLSFQTLEDFLQDKFSI